LEGPLPLGLTRRCRSQPGHRTESVFVGVDGEAVPDPAGKDVTGAERAAAGGIVTISAIFARAEELVRRTEAVAQRGGSERLRVVATWLRSTVLRPLAELNAPHDPAANLEAQTTELEESLLALAMDLTRACAGDHRAALLEACAGAHYLATIGHDDARDR